MSKGFSTYTPEQVYEATGIYAKDAKAIAAFKGLAFPISEQGLAIIKAFADQAKTEGMNISQAIQRASITEPQAATPGVGQAEGALGDLGAILTNKDIQSGMNEARDELATKEALRNLVEIEAEINGVKAADPSVQGFLDMSRTLKSAVKEAKRKVPLAKMAAIALKDVTQVAQFLPPAEPELKVLKSAE